MIFDDGEPQVTRPGRIESNLGNISFASAAKLYRNDRSFDQEREFRPVYDRDRVRVAILEMAHAISRGRNPHSSMIVGNTRTWWMGLMRDESGRDYEDEPCSIITDLDESAQWCWEHPEARAFSKARKVCLGYFSKMRLFKKWKPQIILQEPETYDDFGVSDDPS